MINPAVLGVIGKGIGQSIAFLWLWIDEKLRRYYSGKPSATPSGSVLFYDRSFIENLKLTASDQQTTQILVQTLQP